MKRLLLVICCMLSSCSTRPVVISYSPEVTTTVAAIKDSFDAARIDLANSYTEALSMLVTPPEKRIQIEPIYKDGKRIAVIPDKYKDSNVVIVGTEDWSNLVKTKDIVLQLANDKTNLNTQILSIQEELIEQQKIKQQLAEDNVNLQIKNTEANSSIFRLRAYMIGLISLILVYIYLKTKRIIPI